MTMTKTLETGIAKPRKSVKINPELLEALGKWYKSFDVKFDATRESGINYLIIERILHTKTCSPSTLEKIQSLNLI